MRSCSLKTIYSTKYHSTKHLNISYQNNLCSLVLHTLGFLHLELSATLASLLSNSTDTIIAHSKNLLIQESQPFTSKG